MRRSRAGLGEAGFTLMEAMAAVAAMGAIVLAIAMIAGQWLPNWRRGFVELQRADLLSLGLERIAADVAAAKYVSASGAAQEPLFDGERQSVTFVRSAIEPDAPSRLEIVRIAETVDYRRFRDRAHSGAVRSLNARRAGVEVRGSGRARARAVSPILRLRGPRSKLDRDLARRQAVAQFDARDRARRRGRPRPGRLDRRRAESDRARGFGIGEGRECAGGRDHALACGVGSGPVIP